MTAPIRVITQGCSPRDQLALERPASHRKSARQYKEHEAYVYCRVGQYECYFRLSSPFQRHIVKQKGGGMRKRELSTNFFIIFLSFFEASKVKYLGQFK